MRNVVRLETAALVFLCTITAAAQQAAPGGRPLKQDYNSGEYLYRTFCASCHGNGGAGDGSVAEILRVPPPDLTLIARRNGGTFPRAGVFGAIDGRQAVRGHGPGDMPIWGDVLKSIEGHNEGIIRKRIDAIVIHIESLQAR